MLQMQKQMHPVVSHQLQLSIGWLTNTLTLKVGTLSNVEETAQRNAFCAQASPWGGWKYPEPVHLRAEALCKAPKGASAALFVAYTGIVGLWSGGLQTIRTVCCKRWRSWSATVGTSATAPLTS
jgi:hypothetical protein